MTNIKRRGPTNVEVDGVVVATTRHLQLGDAPDYVAPDWRDRIVPADRDPLTGLFNPETQVQDPLTGEWHTRRRR